jgi:hypothetical protein
MKTAARKKRVRESGDDLWAWAERREAPATIREDPPDRLAWYRGLLKKISGEKDGA